MTNKSIDFSIGGLVFFSRLCNVPSTLAITGEVVLISNSGYLISYRPESN